MESAEHAEGAREEEIEIARCDSLKNSSELAVAAQSRLSQRNHCRHSAAPGALGAV